MAVFGGYDMPLWYSSVKEEHLAVLLRAGLFDTSHMASIRVQGPEAFDLLQHCFTNDLAGCIGLSRKPLAPGRCVYGAFLDSKGHVIDDTIVFMAAEGDYLVVVNAGMGKVVADHLAANAGNRQVEIQDLTDKVGKIDIQGPAAPGIMARVLENPQQVFEAMPYFSFKGHFLEGAPGLGQVRLTDGTALLLSRTGYTGEVGFEIFCDPADVVAIWRRLLETGTDQGLLPCGLAARDSLRAGAVLPLSHQDIGHWPFVNHPWPFALPYTAGGQGFTKTFVGSQALLDLDSANYTYPFAGFDLRKIGTENSQVADDSGQVIGKVLTCASDMGIGRSQGKVISVASPDRPRDFTPKGLSCGFVMVDRPLDYGQVVQLSDGRRKIKVEIVRDIRPDRTARKPLAEFLS